MQLLLFSARMLYLLVVKKNIMRVYILTHFADDMPGKSVILMTVQICSEIIPCGHYHACAVCLSSKCTDEGTRCQ